jgi:hypothetical protein
LSPPHACLLFEVGRERVALYASALGQHDRQWTSESNDA